MRHQTGGAETIRHAGTCQQNHNDGGFDKMAAGYEMRRAGGPFGRLNNLDLLSRGDPFSIR